MNGMDGIFMVLMSSLGFLLNVLINMRNSNER
jgi:hypothetical protein